MKHVGVYVRVHTCRLKYAQNSKMTLKKMFNLKIMVISRTKDIYNDSDIEIKNKIEQVNNVPQINENHELQSEDIVAQKSIQENTATS